MAIATQEIVNRQIARRRNGWKDMPDSAARTLIEFGMKQPARAGVATTEARLPRRAIKGRQKPAAEFSTSPHGTIAGKPLSAAGLSSIVVVLDLPPRILHPNARPHWAAKARATKSYRRAAWAMALAASWTPAPRWKRATVTIWWYAKTKRKADADGILSSLKAAFDGIADAGIVDNDAGMTFMPIERLHDPESPRVMIRVEAA